jgi:hypothetical protein
MSWEVVVGRALARLRSLGGLTRDACAARAGLSVEALDAAERGEALEPMQRLATFHGVDPEEIFEAQVVPLADPAGATVFLLHGPYQDFGADDLTPLARALYGARALTALDLKTGGRRTAKRLSMRPMPCAGPLPRDAARQGYRLADRLRTDLGLGGDPAPDLRVLCEDLLGIAVSRAPFTTSALRAASILDADRSAAAAVLSSVDPELVSNPRLVRVCLAHELCHLLFDPATAGCVQVALDDRDTVGRRAKTSPLALRESRAKGFAAEFLIPRKGVAALLGERTDATTDAVEARRRIGAVRERFDTPWEIATLHLGNLGWIDRSLTGAIRRDPEPGVATPPPPLGSDDELSPLVQQLLAEKSATLDVVTPAAAVDATQPPAWLPASRSHAQELRAKCVDPCVERARQALAAGRPRAAAFAIGERLDGYLLDGAFNAAADLLRDIDAREFPRPVLTAALLATRPVPESLRAEREAFVTRALDALRTHWNLAEPEVADIEARLR